MKARALLAALVLLAPSLAKGAEATLALEGSMVYDDNVFAQPNNTTQDGIAQPAIEIGAQSDHTADLKWDVMYRPSYKQYFSTSGISGFDHLAKGDLSYRLSGATEIYAQEQFQDVQSTTEANQLNASQAAPIAQNALVFAQTRVILNDFTAGLRHQFSPVLGSELSLVSSYYDPSQKNQASAFTNSGGANLIYALSATDRIGSGFTFTNQQFDATQNRESSWTRFYQLSAIWIHDFSPSLSLDLRAGPTYVEEQALNNQVKTGPVPLYPAFNTKDLNGQDEVVMVDVTSCPKSGGLAVFSGGCKFTAPLSADQKFLLTEIPVLGPGGGIQAFGLQTTVVPTVLASDLTGGNTSNLTYFAEIALTKKWQLWDSSLSYRRSEGTSSGYNQSTILDTVEGRVGWHPSELWDLSLTASYNRRTASSDQTQEFVALGPLDPADARDNVLLTSGGFSPNTAKVIGVTTAKFTNALNVDTWLVYLNLNRRITRRLSLFGLVSYTDQTSTGEINSSDSYNRFRAQIGLRYVFDPYPL